MDLDPGHPDAGRSLIAGEIDLIEAVAHDLLPLLEQARQIRIIRTRRPNQYASGMNWLLPPFNNAEERRAAMLALNQDEFLEAAIGDRRYWRVCKALFTCGETIAGMTGLINGDADRAHALLKEAGYDGT